MSKFEQDYSKLLIRAIDKGVVTTNRTGINAKTLFGEDLIIDIKKGFPILTGKKIFFDKALHEYLWIKDGGTTIKYLNDHDIKWWNSYANAKGELGKVYGWQLRSFNGEEDQLMNAVNEIRNNSRRAHITMWNPSDLPEQALPCCYTGITFVRINNELNMNIDFRSSDLVLGLPYDIIFAALLLTDVADFCELGIGKIKLNLNNAHIYLNNVQAAKRYLSRITHRLPKYNVQTRELIDYKCGEYIEAPLNV